jgi:F-type H+-transporting ATPase subunit alpha
MANLKVKEMTEVIKKQIEAYTKDTKLESIGSVLSVGDGIAIVYGLKDAMMGEYSFFHTMSQGLFLTSKKML